MVVLWRQCICQSFGWEPCFNGWMMKPKQYGFTIIELLVACAIVIIVGKMALTLYTGYVQKSRRSEAITTLLGMQLAEEKYRSSNSTYGTLAQVWGGVTTTPSGYYTLVISNNTATGYTLTATAVGTQINDSENGTSCSPLQITMSNGTETKTPSVCFAR